MKEGTVFLVFIVALVLGGAAVFVWLRSRETRVQTQAQAVVAVRRDAVAAPPEYWVGVTRYEGTDPAAADRAFNELRDDLARTPGDVELMKGADRVRFFKVV